MRDRYTPLEVIGRGSTATVHRAEDREHPGRIVAVKRVEGADIGDALEREVAALTRLAHPSIVRILDVVDDAGGAALVTPWLPGGSLADRLAAAGSLTALEVADLGARVGDALAAAHDAGVVHRDVKPANILYDAEEQPLLADFGAALLDRGGDGWITGTAAYLDPAVARDGAEPDARSDQYGLAVTLYEALAGLPPFAAATAEATLRAAERGVHVPLGQHVPDVPAELCDLVERGLARDPQERFATVRELASRLAEVRIRLAQDAGPAGLDPTPPTWRAAAARPEPSGPPPRPPSDGTAPYAPPPPTPTDERDTAPAAAADVGGDGGTGSGTRAGSGTGATASVTGPGNPGSVAAPDATTRFGPAPPRPTAAPTTDGRRLRPWMLVAAAVVVLVPLGVLLAFVLGGDDAPELTDGDTETATVSRPELPACDDAPDAPETAEVLAADLTGEGCTVPIGWDPDSNVLTLPRADQAPVRFQLGQPGDVLVLGSWECDSIDAPALYRPDTGQVFTFGRFGDPDSEIESRPAQDTGVTDGTPRVVRDGEGCDRVEVDPT